MIVYKRHLNYLKYVLRHKWFVFLAGLGEVPLWILILHDWDKFLPDEWFPYANYFYGNLPTEKEARTAYLVGIVPYTRERCEADFDKSWLLHQNRNKHHWQYWVLLEDDGGTKVLPMPEPYRSEMIADWRGAGRAITGQDNTSEWYAENYDHIQLHPETRHFIDTMLHYLPPLDFQQEKTA